MSKNKDLSTKDFVLGVVFGATVSAIAALLFAPKSGKELRKDLGETTSKTLESTDEYLDLAREKGSKVMHDVEDAASTYFSIAENKMKSAFTKAEDQLDKTADNLDDLVEDTIEEIDEMNATEETE